MRTIRGLLAGYLLIALCAGWPIATVATAGAIARWNGCTLHEGAAHPCLVGGWNLGGTLYTMSVLGWFMIATIPLGVVAFVGWTTVWLVWRTFQKRYAA
jgi:hypothetical protein